MAGIGTVLFICASALFVYNNTEHLVATRDWRDHSQEVLRALQTISQRLDHIDMVSRLYVQGKNEDDLQSAASNTVALDTGILHLEELVKDDPQQLGLARDLDVRAKKLMQEINAQLPQGIALSKDVLECRDEVGHMQEDERNVLAKRIEESRRNTYRSLLAGAVFLLLSLAVVVSLFAILLRNARRRRIADLQLSKANAQLADTVETLQKRATEASLLMAAREEMQLCTNPVQAHHAVIRYCKQLLPSTHAALLMINNSRQMVEIVSASEDEGKILDGFPLDACCGLRSGRLRWRKLGQSEVHCSHFMGNPPENYLCIPLAAHGDTLGILYIECPTAEADAIVANTLGSLEELAEMASMSIAGLNLRSRLEHQSIRDGLTNLFNRHFMEISLDREIRRAARNKAEFSVLMLDVDHFKLFNDTYGHEAGDNILREVAEIFRQSVRAEDIICRYGGEEFVIILPETAPDAALERSETIRQRVKEMRMRFRGEALRELTISIGVAVYPHSGDTLEEMLRASDRALYIAKQRGRNQVVMPDMPVTI
jgi:diguanylate cyclase (GGDEF)-like protein